MWAVRLELQRTIAKQCQQPVPQARRLLKAHTQAKVEAGHWEHRPSISHMGSSPILQAGGSDAEDGHKIGRGSALWFEEDQVFRMYYFANSQADVDCGLANPDFAAGSIFLAESEDCIHWTKKGFVLQPDRKDPDSFDHGGLGVCSVTRTSTGDLWMALFGVPRQVRCSGAGSHILVLQGSDATVSIGMAHSRDGVHWAKASGQHPGGSVLQRSTTPDDWDSYAVTNPCLVEASNGQLLMYYHSGRPRPAQGSPDRPALVWQIGHAVSLDSQTWEKLGPIIWANPEVTQELNGRASPFILPNPYAAGYLMFYLMIDQVPARQYAHGSVGRFAIGVATSPDGVTWSRLGDGPIIEGTPRTFDERGAGHPSVFLNPHSGLLHMLYQGSPNAGIGMAVMEEQGNLRRWRKVSPSRPELTA